MSCQTCFAQEILDRISIKTGMSYSVMSWGAELTSHIVPPYKSINAVFMNIQYSQPIKRHELNIGLQMIEKGLSTSIRNENIDSKSLIDYQYRLNYLEAPINFVYKYDKYRFIVGLITSYMYDMNFRYQETDIVYGNNYHSTTIYYSNYSFTTNKTGTNQRYNQWDFGGNIGVNWNFYKNFDTELTIQKHFIQIDKEHQRDLGWNVCFLLGLRYRFLSSK